MSAINDLFVLQEMTTDLVSRCEDLLRRLDQSGNNINEEGEVFPEIVVIRNIVKSFREMQDDDEEEIENG